MITKKKKKRIVFIDSQIAKLSQFLGSKCEYNVFKVIRFSSLS